MCRDEMFPGAAVWNQASLQMDRRTLLGVIEMF